MLSSGHTLGVEEAYGALENYGRTYGELPLRLLLHVAVPQRFRADFVNLAKLNFLPAEAQGNLSLDADVLFAPMVEHLGAGYFQMDAEVRRQSLMLLVRPTARGESCAHCAPPTCCWPISRTWSIGPPLASIRCWRSMSPSSGG